MTDDRNRGGGERQRIDVEALLGTVDIVRVIEGYLSLTKAGAHYEACCPFHTEDSPSFKVSPKKQFFHCYGCGANGDAIKFLMEYRGVSFLEACRELGADVPEAADAPVTFRPPEAVRRQSKKEQRAEPTWVPVMPVPEASPPPPRAHIKRGFPEATWCYRDAQGLALGWVYRFLKSGGGKETLPLTWCRCEETGAQEWRWISFSVPRILYGLDRLAAKPAAPVLLVEGEKCADAGDGQLPGWAVASWPGGCRAEGKADWAPMKGRDVYTWADADAKRVPLTKAEKEATPDKEAQAALQAGKPYLLAAEQPGTLAMRSIHGHLHALGARVWEVRLPAVGEQPDGWDIADAVAEGLTGADLEAWIRARAVRVMPPGMVDAVSPSSAPETASTPSGACASPLWDEEYDRQVWRRELLRLDGKLIDCRENVYLILRHHPDWQGVIWANEFSRRIEVRRPPPWQAEDGFRVRVWDSIDDLRLGLWLAHRERMLVRNEKSIERAVAWAASDSRWHPVRDFLDALVWDGVPRTREWMTDYMGAEKTPYTSLAGHFFLIGMVARIYQPGCQMRFMPIFEGRQYRGKSSAARILGGEWYADTILDLHSKDAYQNLQGVWIYEIGELDAFSRADTTKVKAFVSSQRDRFRVPYEANPADHERQVLFIGSTNQDEYFKDATGNTRFWPIRCDNVEAINLAGLAAHRDQLLAEAVQLFKAGERWHPTAQEQTAYFEPEQAAREIGDPWQPMITRYLRGLTTHRVTVDQILTECLKIEPGKIDRGKQQATSVGIAMKRIGWIKRRETSGDREWYYQRPDDWDVPAQAPAAGSEGDDYAPF
ncbi:MAG: VapE domain-containing protein [Anaerolineae bacterium]